MIIGSDKIGKLESFLEDTGYFECSYREVYGSQYKSETVTVLITPLNKYVYSVFLYDTNALFTARKIGRHPKPTRIDRAIDLLPADIKRAFLFNIDLF